MNTAEVLYDKLLVKVDVTPDKSPGGIVIPDSAKETPPRGEVVARGQGRLNNNAEFISLTVEVGDVVLFRKGAGVKVDLDSAEENQELLVLSEGDVLVRFPKEKSDE